MKLEVDYDAQIQMSTLRPERLKVVEGHLSALQNWENDPAVRKLSRPHPTRYEKDLYLLEATDGFRIFFSLGSDTITVRDITTKATLDRYAGVK
ncbi:MAG: hypothetical protein U0791_02965 [Gemmataceae bacterium]